MDNVTKYPDRERIKEEAGLWLARLDRGLHEDERAELRHWLAQSRFHESCLRELVKNWQNMDVLSALAELFPLEQHGDRVARSWRGPMVWLAASTSAFAILATVIVVLRGSGLPGAAPAPTPESYQTAIGQQASFLLQDGTTIGLNTNSRVTVDFSDSVRSVSLLRGEVNFQVAKDARRPFLVRAGSGVVWAVGTQFNVRLFPDFLDVVVTEGKVKILDAAAVADSDLPRGLPDAESEPEDILQAGQSARYRSGSESLQATAPELIEKQLAWQRGSLIFTGESLEDALKEVARYTDQKLIIADPGINDLPIGGRFKTNDIDGFITALTLNFDVRVERAPPNRIYLFGKAAPGSTATTPPP